MKNPIFVYTYIFRYQYLDRSQPRFSCPAAMGRSSNNNYTIVHAGGLFGILHPYQTSLIDLIGGVQRTSLTKRMPGFAN